MLIFDRKKFFLNCLLMALVLNMPSAFAFNAAYSHYSENEDISAVLLDFARSEGLNAKISDLISGKVSGSFENMKPADFLDVLHSAFGVKYYLQGKIINFYHDSEWGQGVYKPSSINSNDLVESLRKAHVLADDLPLTIDNNGMLIIQGPESYINNLLAVARSFDKGQENDLVMQVFKLKHAKVNDLAITTSSGNVIVPGVATLLQRMVSGSTTGSSSVAVSPRSQVMQGLRGTGLASTGKSNDSAASSSSAANSTQSKVDEGGSQSFSPNIIADSRLNALLIYDYKHRMPFYQQVIEEIDVPIRMVELHAAVIDVDVDVTESLGLTFQATSNSGNWTLDGSRGVISTTDGGFTRTSGGVFSTVFNTSHNEFMMQINALESDGKAKTLGRPSILTVENVDATLENTTTNYVPVSGNDSSDLFQIKAGTVLQVNPHIIDSLDGGEPIIQMIITLKTNQDSTGSDITSASSTTYVPSVKETTINTQAMVKQGQSLLIGGYYIETKTEKDEGIPVLKDIPLLGRLFSSTTEVRQKRERILIITPRIVSYDDLNTLPEGIDADFDKFATQTTYKDRTDATLNNTAVQARAENTPGCASTRSIEPKSESQTSNKPVVESSSPPVLATALDESVAQPIEVKEATVSADAVESVVKK